MLKSLLTDLFEDTSKKWSSTYWKLEYVLQNKLVFNSSKDEAAQLDRRADLYYGVIMFKEYGPHSKIQQILFGLLS